MLRGILMFTTQLRRLRIIFLAVVILILAACDRNPNEWKTPNMTKLTPRLQTMFEKSKTICFGRFMVDVPESATVVWGESLVPLGIDIYPDGVDKVKVLAQKFIDELKSEKAINHDDVPLLISVDDVVRPEGKIVTGYEDFEAINGLKIRGYFRLDNAGVVIDARPLRGDKDETMRLIKSIAHRLRSRVESEIPAEPGNCIEHAFLIDEPNPNKEQLLEHIRIGFRLNEFPDAHFSIYVAPSNPYDPEGDSLEAQFKRMREGAASAEERKSIANTKFFRESPRRVADWKTGYEVLMRSPDEEGVHAHHEFLMKFTGVPRDLFKPYADIQFQTGVADNAAGATKTSLTDEEAIAVWDKITSTIRVRPTRAAPVKSAQGAPQPRLPLGELAATGRACPQTGWWQASEAGEIEGGARQYFRAGETMPQVTTLGESSLWQKIKGARPSYRTATVWKLVDYDATPIRADEVPHTQAIAQAAPDAANPDGSQDDESSRHGKG
jgi:hypothetical protein